MKHTICGSRLDMCVGVDVYVDDNVCVDVDVSGYVCMPEGVCVYVHVDVYVGVVYW